MATRSSNRARIRSAVGRRLGIDERAIAVFRVLLGLTLLFDVVHRATDLRAFYTDAGVLPRSLLYAESGRTATLSLHALSGDAWFQALLFVLTGLVAIALVVGYRPRLAAALAVVLVFSLHWRNPLVLNAGDRLFRELLLLAVFLPLAERWAVRPSAREALEDEPGDDTQGSRWLDRVRWREGSRIATPATAAAMIHVVTLFFSNAGEKLAGTTWPTGQALDYAFRQDHMTILLGEHLVEFPALLELGTYGWFGLLCSAPLLLLTADRLRLVHCLAFLGAISGLALTMAIGLFPAALAAGVVLFLPPRFWNVIERIGPRIRRSVADRREGRDGSIPAGVGDSLARLRGATRTLGISLTRFDRGLDAAADRVVTPTTRTLADRGWTIVLVLLLCGIAVLSVGLLGWAQPVDPVADVSLQEYAWDVYAPDPGDDYGYLTVTAEREDSAPVDVFRETELTAPPPPDPSERIPSFRWRKYTVALFGTDADAHREAYAAYMCTRAGERFDGTVTSVRITYTRHEIVVPGGENGIESDVGGDPDSTMVEVTTRSCG